MTMKQFRCADCHTIYPKWSKQCPSCKGWTLIEDQASSPSSRSWLSISQASLERMDQPILSSSSASSWRIPLSNPELARVFGGGIFAGSLTVLSGSPGSGKSTLALQLAGMVGESFGKTQQRVLYISGEETSRQVLDRARRLCPSSVLGRMDLVTSGNLGQILDLVKDSPAIKFIVCDSIQTMTLDELDSEAGGVVQVRACATKLMQLAKARDIAVLLVSHVTKDGSLAGPRTLEHLVDVVLQLDNNSESLVSSEVRWLTAHKNRFGACETGMLKLTSRGLEALEPHTDLYISHRSSSNNTLSVGAAWTICSPANRGSRFVLAEVQSLASRTSNPLGPVYKSSGIPKDRVNLITTVLANHVPGLEHLGSRDMFLNSVGNVALDNDRGSDLGIAMALASSGLNSTLQWPATAGGLRGLAFVGEVGLGGEIRPSREMSARLAVAEGTQLHTLVVPSPSLNGLQNLKLNVVGVDSIKRCVDMFLRLARR